MAIDSQSQPFVGRERERAKLRACLADAISGHGSLVLISGEAGIGKTTLVELFVNRLTGRPRTTCFIGRCAMSYGAGEAYGPVLEALGRLGKAPAGGELTRVLARYAPMWLVPGHPKMVSVTSAPLNSQGN